MIKADKVLVKVNLRNQQYYRKLGYNIKDISIGETIDLYVDISDLTKGSKVRVIAICEICNSENNLMYSKYYQNYHRNNKNYYSCFKCKSIEKKKTCIKKYGVDSYSKTDEFKKFISENLNYNEIHKKCRKTNIERYGVEYYFQTDSVKELNREWMSSDKFREKSKETLFKKYGVDSYSKTDEFKNKITQNKKVIVEKIKNTFTERYGKEWISQTEGWKRKYKSKYSEIRKGVKETCIKKYGVDNVSKVESIMDRVMDTKLTNGVIIPIEVISKWEQYKRIVKKLTNRNKKELYENWDGVDYYDSERIIDNLSLDNMDKLYPTIDHKISLFYGFSNDISPEDISDISNLCITKRTINSKKNKLTEEEFKLKNKTI